MAIKYEIRLWEATGSPPLQGDLKYASDKGAYCCHAYIKRTTRTGSGGFVVTHYVLIDFENIQPEAEALSFLNNKQIHIIIFANAKQKLTIDRAKTLQAFGDRVDYIEMSDSGKNAIDFMIAFYIGHKWHENPGANFHVVSKDTGFDPLLKHLTTIRAGVAKRVTDLAEIKNALPGIVRQRVADICAALTALPETDLPESVIAFESFIMTTLNDPDMPEHHTSGLLSFMRRKELIVTDEGGVKYQFENIAAGAAGQFVSKAPANVAPPQPAPLASIEELAKKTCDNLKKRGNSKPRTLNTLASTIKAIFNGGLSDQQLSEIIDLMKARGIIAVSNDTKINYRGI